jgi:hypothetical protein
VVLVAAYVAYYFLYQNYINKRLAGTCKQRRLPHPTTTIMYLVLLFSIIFNIIISVEFNRVNEENASLRWENHHFSKVLYLCEIDDNSPYSYYRDVITSNDSYGYQVTYTESNDFHFYFAHSAYEDFSGTEYYPEYICYIQYTGVLAEDIDVTIEYIYNENNRHSETGGFDGEIMLLSRNLERLPREIKITIRERGTKSEEGNIITDASFTLYTINK